MKLVSFGLFIDAGEAEGGEPPEHDPAAAGRPQPSAPQGPGGRGQPHQDPGAGEATAPAEGRKVDALRMEWVLPSVFSIGSN